MNRANNCSDCNYIENLIVQRQYYIYRCRFTPLLARNNKKYIHKQTSHLLVLLANNNRPFHLVFTAFNLNSFFPN